MLQGYLQIVSGLLALFFAAVTSFVFRNSGRISLILGAGFFFPVWF